MVTLEYIKSKAKSLDAYDIWECKDRAYRYNKMGLWWTYECVEMYQKFLTTNYKVFWWSMVVRTLRYANTYYRKLLD